MNFSKIKETKMLAAILVAAALATSTTIIPQAYASSPKFTSSGGTSSAGCTVLSNFSLECTGEMTGLGGGPAQSHLTATVSANFDCFNPSGAGPNPGHSGPGIAAGPTTPLSVSHNGRATFDDFIPAPTGPDAPNPGWTCSITYVSYSNVNLVVDTVSGQYILPIAGTFTAGTP